MGNANLAPLLDACQNRSLRVNDQREHQPSWKKLKGKTQKMRKLLAIMEGMRRKKLGQLIYEREEET
jgi:hypothetical protein